MPPRAVRAGSTTSPTPTSAITGCVMAPNLRPCTRSAQARTSGDRPDPTATTIATLPVWKPSGKPPLFARAKSTAARSQLSSHATSSWPESGMTKTNVCKRVAIQHQRKADVRATSCQGAPGAGTGRQPASSKPFRSASSVVPTTSAEGTSCAGTAMIAVSLVCGLVARTSAFRWRWMATRLHTFVFVIPLSGQEDVAWLDSWLRAAVDFARANKGGLPEGFQTGSVAMVVAVGSGLSPEVRAWAERVHGRKFGAITHPVIADVGVGDVVEPARTALGGIYYSYLRGIVTSIVRPAVERTGRATGV